MYPYLLALLIEPNLTEMSSADLGQGLSWPLYVAFALCSEARQGMIRGGDFARSSDEVVRGKLLAFKTSTYVASALANEKRSVPIAANERERVECETEINSISRVR